MMHINAASFLTCTIPPLAIPALRCQCGQALTGLFFLYRPKRYSGDNVRTTIIDLFGEKEEKFMLSMTDRRGHLILIINDDPWKSYYDAHASPHGIKVLPDTEYEYFAVRHPNIVFVREVLEELNSGGVKTITKDWVPTTAVFSLSGVEGMQEAVEMVASIPEGADWYYPQGSERYGKFILYRDMPNSSCAPVVEAVTRLQHDLGALRYIVGGQDDPYNPEVEKISYGKVLNKNTVNCGIFDGRTISAVHRFQIDVNGGIAFKLNNFSSGGGEIDADGDVAKEWAYLIGNHVELPKGSLTEDGVVCINTANHIEEWKSERLRQPGKILLPIKARELKSDPNWFTWLREEAAYALHAWRELVKSFGFDRTIQANHTYRGILVDVDHASGYGVALRSIHKVGLAVDVGVKGNFFDADDHWPIIYSRDALTERKKKGQVIGYVAQWRLFAPSMCGKNILDNPAYLREKLGNILTLNKFTSNKLLLDSVNYLIFLVENNFEEFKSRFFRARVQRWVYDAWADEGGVPGGFITPAHQLDDEVAVRENVDVDLNKQLVDLNSQTTDKVVRDQIKAVGSEIRGNSAILKSRKKFRRTMPDDSFYVDLTELAEVVGLKRIGSFVNKVDPTSSDWGLAAIQVPTSKFSLIVEKLKLAKSHVPNGVIELKGLSFSVNEVDLDFCAAWCDALNSFSKSGASNLGVVAGCEISIKMSSSVVKSSSKTRIETFLGMLAEFKDRKFRWIEGDAVKTGSDWSGVLEDEIMRLQETAPAFLVEAERGSSKKPHDTHVYTFRPILGVNIGGDFIEFPAKVSLTVPDAGTPRGMEWWHFQVSDLINGKLYGQMLSEIGFSETCLGEAVAGLYWRPLIGYSNENLTAKAY